MIFYFVNENIYKMTDTQAYKIMYDEIKGDLLKDLSLNELSIYEDDEDDEDDVNINIEEIERFLYDYHLFKGNWDNSLELLNENEEYYTNLVFEDFDDIMAELGDEGLLENIRFTKNHITRMFLYKVCNDVCQEVLFDYKKDYEEKHKAKTEGGQSPRDEPYE